MMAHHVIVPPLHMSSDMTAIYIQGSSFIAASVLLDQGSEIWTYRNFTRDFSMENY